MSSIFDRQLPYVVNTFTHYYHLFLRIWGSFGQKLIEKTRIVVISNSIDGPIERALALLKISGLKETTKLSFTDIKSKTDIIEINQFSILIVEHLIYDEIKKYLKFSMAIIYGNSWFKTIFTRRICNIKYKTFNMMT